MTTATTTLTDFLLARIAEDESAARAATQGRWEYRNPYSVAGVGGAFAKPGKCTLCHAGPPIWTGRRDINGTVMEAHVHLFEPFDHSIVVLEGGDVLTVVPDADEYGHIDEADGAHIARHDPARVLADCEARRKVVRNAQTYLPGESGYGAATYAVQCLAAVYSDHPDYDETWKP